MKKRSRRILSPSAKMAKQKRKARSAPAKATRGLSSRLDVIRTVRQQNKRRRSYLTKDLSKLQLNWSKRRSSGMNRLSHMQSPHSKKIHVRYYYRSPKTECKRHGYNLERCKSDPRCIMSARGCQMATIGQRTIVHK